MDVLIGGWILLGALVGFVLVLAFFLLVILLFSVLLATVVRLTLRLIDFIWRRI